MDTYSIALFLHIVGALGIAIALGLEWVGLSQIRNAARPEQVRSWMMLLKNSTKVGFLSMLTAVISGAYMMATGWGGVPWLFVTLGSLVLIIALSAALTRPRMMAIGQALAMGKGELTQTFHNLVNQPILWLSIQTRSAIVLGIIFLKIAKPDWGGSLLTIGVAIALGLASALPFPRRVRAGQRPAD